MKKCQVRICYKKWKSGGRKVKINRKGEDNQYVDVEEGLE